MTQPTDRAAREKELNDQAQKVWDEAGEADLFAGRQFAIELGCKEWAAADAAWEKHGAALAKWRSGGSTRKESLLALGQFGSALAAAANNGRADWVQRLLDATPKRHLPGEALLTAAMEGAQARAKAPAEPGVDAAAVARMLLGRGAQIKPAADKRALLMRAAGTGRADLVAIALEVAQEQGESANARIQLKQESASALDFAVDARCDSRGGGAFEALWAAPSPHAPSQANIDCALRRAAEGFDLIRGKSDAIALALIGQIAERASDKAIEANVAWLKKRKLAADPLVAEQEARVLRKEIADHASLATQKPQKGISRRL